jgi:predicted metal-dependent phosphoesterase TrpH
MARTFVDLHCHSRGSFDCLSDPRDMMEAAAARGLTHLAITDHDRIDVALEARDRAPAGLTVIVGEEVKTLDGDLICLFLERAIEPGLSAAETIAAARLQGGLVGIPHPFDRMRGSLLRDAAMASLASKVDWVETHNARVVGHGNEDAATFALDHGLPGISVSDAHSIMEIGVAYTVFDGDPSTAAGLLTVLRSAEIVPGRASFYIRAWTPIAKLVNRARGNGRVRPATTGAETPGVDPTAATGAETPGVDPTAATEAETPGVDPTEPS